MAEHWTRHRPPVGDDAVKSYQPKQVSPLTERLGHADVQALIARYRAEETQQELADAHRTSVSSVRRLVRDEGAQRWRRSDRFIEADFQA